MRKELNEKVKAIIGAIALIISGMLTSYFMCQYQKDWIALVAIIVFSILFLRCFTCEGIEEYVYDKLSKWINIVSIAFIFLALALLPDSAGTIVSKNFQGIIYFVSFICWFIGLYLQEIRTKYKNYNK